MISLDLKLNFNCNANCIHCFISDRRNTPQLSFDKIKEIISGLEEGSLVVLTGGEPTLRKDFIEILKFVKFKKHFIILQTNGFKFSDLEFAKKCKPYIDETVMTIHSHIPQINNDIMQSKESYDLVIKALNNLYKLNMGFSTQTVISSYNSKTLPATYDFIQKNWPGVKMHLTYPHTVGAAANIDSIDPIDNIDVYTSIKKILASWHDLIIPIYIPMCYLYPYHYSTDYTNSEYDCNTSHTVLGYDTSVSNELINFLEMKSESFIKNKNCNGCIFNNKCKGFWQSYFNNFGILPTKQITDIHKPLSNIQKLIKINDNNILELNDISNRYEYTIQYYAKNQNDFIPIFKKINELGFKGFEIYPNDLSHNQTKQLVNNILHNFPYNTRTSIFIKDVPYCITGEYYDFVRNTESLIKKEKAEFCEQCIFNDQCSGFTNNLDTKSLIPILKIRKLKSLINIQDDIIFFVSNFLPDNFNDKYMRKLDFIIKDIYLLLRNDHSNIELIYQILDELFIVLKNKTRYILPTQFYNRLLSLIALKNDMLLQFSFKKEYIDKYLNELMYIVKKEKYYEHRETPIKILEILTKLDIAYKSLNHKNNISIIAKDFISKLNLDGYFIEETKLLSKKIVSNYVFDTFFLYYYYFNNNMIKNEEYNDYILNEIWLELNYYKKLHYKLSKEELLNNTGYNFIWD